jgi:predicted nucleotidyltransferase
MIAGARLCPFAWAPPVATLTRVVGSEAAFAEGSSTRPAGDQRNERRPALHPHCANATALTRRNYLDSRTATFVADVLAAVDSVAPVRAAYLLGSAAVGGFDPSTSDVDLVVVIERPLGTKRARVVGRLASLEVPARDLELVVYVQGCQPPDFELNLNEGAERPNEEPFWFILDAALAQEHAVPVWGRRRWSEFFDPISPEATRKAMKESLAWAQRQPRNDDFARVHAARARHYLEQGEWIAKEAAEERRWAG